MAKVPKYSCDGCGTLLMTAEEIMNPCKHCGSSGLVLELYIDVAPRTAVGKLDITVEVGKGT